MGTPSNRSAGTQITKKGIVQGVTLVDPATGLPVDVILDSHGTRRLAVDANVTVDDITVETRPLNASTDNVAVKDPVSGFVLKINSDGSIDSNVMVDAAARDNVAIGNTWKKLIDQPNATTTYIGIATPGTATSAALWQIKRILVTGTLTAIEFSGGTLGFDKVWDNRASLTYS